MKTGLFGLSLFILNFVLFQKSIAHQVPFTLFTTTNDTVSASQLNNLRFEQSNITQTHPNEIYWIKVDMATLLPGLDNQPEWYLKIGLFNKASLFFQENTAISERKFGSFQIMGNPNQQLYDDRIIFSTKNLIDGRFLYLKLQKLTHRVRFLPNGINIITPESNLLEIREYQTRRYKSIVLIYLFLGMGITLLIFTSAIYIRTYLRDFLYYSIYIFFFVVFLGRNTLDFYVEIFGGNSFVTFFGSNAFEILASIFYIQFVRTFIKTSKEYRRFDRFLVFGIWFLVVFLIADSLLLISDYFATHLTLLYLRAIVLSTFVLVAVLYLVFYVKTPLKHFIIAGSLMYSLGSVLIFSTGNKDYMVAGVMAEAIIFGLGLAYKVSLINSEKLKMQQQALDHQLSAMRAQLNPHFIFNSLGSIQHLVLSGMQNEALSYLGKFSKLMRGTLEHSSQEKTLLSDEINLLKTYLELESLRFDNDFRYEFSVDKNLDPQAVELPQLVIQPHVENAILHGLLPKEKGGKCLKISFKKADDFLTCTIEDNGIGRSESRKLRNNKHRSLGLKLTEQHLAVLSKTNEKQAVSIEDLTDENGNPTGTRVIMRIRIL